MMSVRHAVSIGSDGTKTCGDSGVLETGRLSAGVFMARLSTALPAQDCGAMLITRRGTGLRYSAGVEHTTDFLKRIVIRDTSLAVLDSAFDLLILASGPANAAITQVTLGAVTGTSGAELIALPSCTVSRAAAGLWDLTLSTALPATSCYSIQIGRRGSGTRWHPAVAHTSDTVKRVAIVDAAAAALDADFNVIIHRAT